MNSGSGRFNRRKFLACGAGLLPMARPALSQPGSIPGDAQSCEPTDGLFRPNWESLKAYRCPDSFRDLKSGIWAHRSPRFVPEQDDWYSFAAFQE